jgi:uridine monophosphate synthetase
LKAVDTLTEAGLRVTDAVVLIDREQGGPEALAAKGYRLHAALRLPEIMDTLLSAGRISAEAVMQVKNYRAV